MDHVILHYKCRTPCEILLLLMDGNGTGTLCLLLHLSLFLSLTLSLISFLDCSCLVSRRIQMEFHMKLAGAAVVGRTDGVG